MARDNRAVENRLLNKFGFTDSTNRGNKHRWIEITLPGLPVIATYFSHTREDIGPVLWNKIAKQLRVRPSFLNGMIDCTKSKENYEEQVSTAPYPPFDTSF